MSNKKNKNNEENKHKMEGNDMPPIESEKESEAPVDALPEDISKKALPEDLKNAAGESKTHQEAMSENHSAETRPEKGSIKHEDEAEVANSPGTETQGSTEDVSDSKNAAGQSSVKTDLEKESEKPS